MHVWKPLFRQHQSLPIDYPTKVERVDIIANLGASSNLTEDDAEAFMYEFLSDKFVLPLPFPFRQILAKRIAKKRKSIYCKNSQKVAINGRSPIFEYTESLAKKVEKLTGRKTYFAYRYGKNNLSNVIEKARANKATQFCILPMFPQNSVPTTQSMKNALGKIKKFSHEKFDFIESYCDNPLYIQALTDSIKDVESDALIASFHSVPMSMKNPYAQECEKTIELLCQKSGRKNVLLGWQSKTGKGKWLEPSTESLIRKLTARGIKNIAVLCAGFSIDCTETLIEIDSDLRKYFHERGGEKFTYIPCLNDSDTHAEILCNVLKKIK